MKVSHSENCCENVSWRQKKKKDKTKRQNKERKENPKKTTKKIKKGIKVNKCMNMSSKVQQNVAAMNCVWNRQAVKFQYNACMNSITEHGNKHDEMRSRT